MQRCKAGCTLTCFPPHRQNNKEELRKTILAQVGVPAGKRMRNHDWAGLLSKAHEYGAFTCPP